MMFGLDVKQAGLGTGKKGLPNTRPDPRTSATFKRRKSNQMGPFRGTSRELGKGTSFHKEQNAFKHKSGLGGPDRSLPQKKKPKKKKIRGGGLRTRRTKKQKRRGSRRLHRQ